MSQISLLYRFTQFNDKNKTRIVETMPDVRLSGRFIGGLSPLPVPDTATLKIDDLTKKALQILKQSTSYNLMF